MANHEHSAIVPAQRQVIEETSHAMHSLSPALAIAVRRIDVIASPGMMLGYWALRLVSVVAFTESPIQEHRHSRAGEGDLDGLDGTSQIRREDGVESINTPPLSERPSLLTPNRGKAAVGPPARYTPLVVLAGGVRLVHDLDHDAQTVATPQITGQ